MSRAKVTTAVPMATGVTATTPPMLEEPGLSGPYSLTPVTDSDPRVRSELTRILEAVRTLRPLLRERQAATEEAGQYAPDVHDYFIEHGLYSVLAPQKFGGSELGIPAFFAVIAEVARGCPSTAWCLSLSVAHSLTLASYWNEEAQSEIFGANDYMIGPSSGNPIESTVERVEGGYLISGTWRYCSGAPYSTHFFPVITVPATDERPEFRAWAVVERDDYTVLDDWGRVIGMRGSGSNGIRIDKAFVPFHHVSEENWTSEATSPAVGYGVHRNPTYSGVFFGFAEGEVAAVSVGLGYAAIDEYERIIRTTKAPFDPNGARRADADDWRRVLGMAMARVDTAGAALVHSGRQYEEFARQLVEREYAFDAARSMRLNNAYFVVEELVWESLQELIRTAGTGFSADGQKMQRYFRDIWTTVGRTDQFQFFAAPAMQFHFEGPPPID
ncbi:acyl-CoA dehydrogenase family protein [Millisia brevis]|uniref:acyl-CoA dehydrogenase family protein n=1 Tax=Millisia brevis TaxID=264148 RepID=UPI000A0120DA|nr:acyl-CoA dehydrogenase family protein [Millisia brevis]